MSRQTRILAVAMIWLVILGAGAVVVKKFIFPSRKEHLFQETSSSSQYKYDVRLALDSFSGYSLLRSKEMQANLRDDSIRLTCIDDKADYAARINALRDRKVEMAVFTIDSLITSSVKLGECPATIVFVLDESNSADAIVAYEPLKSIADLDKPTTKFVLTPNSASDFLARIVLAEFSLPRLPSDWMIPANGAEEVYKQLRNGNRAYAYALWEPFVTKSLEIPGVRILLDSSKLRGYIVDVIVVERKFLRDQPELVEKVIAAYLRTLYAMSNDLSQVVMGDGLSKEQADKLVASIEWKTTVENYAYFGLVPSRQHIEDIILNIVDVLVKTKAVPGNTVKANQIFYDGVLKNLQSANFHPAKKTNLLGLGGDLGSVRVADELPSLSQEDWDKLLPVGNISTENINFGRGTSVLNAKGHRELRLLADRLNNWPHYYLLVLGETTAQGDAEANKRLAIERANTVVAYLISLGVNKNRVQAKAVPSQVDSSSSVSFLVGQRAY